MSTINDIRENKLTFREAEATYRIPRSTLHDYATGKVEFGCRPGPSSILTAAEEQKIVDYAVEMSKIGYGLTREKILEMVKKMLDKDGRPNAFKGNLPGRKWWKLFMQRHPQLSVRMPEALQLARARCCTPEALQVWYSDFDQFSMIHNVKNQPLQIWNADEAGFPLCPKTGKVLALRNSKNVYSVTGDSKEQITCLCAVSAAGEVIPPMHIFAGVRFRYNPMADCVPGAYFGRSPNGWISTELFFGWIANHFARYVKERPVVLLVDGHSCHIDIEISKFCNENGILLYCLPPHSSHITQPLDVGFFKPLKVSWAKACDTFSLEHPGTPVSKDVFSSVFRKAWEASVNVSTIVNSFRSSGICPLNYDAIDSSKLGPSLPYSACKQVPESTALKSLEAEMKPETLSCYRKRYEEKYDLDSDELYNIWSRLKTLSMSSDNDKEVPPTKQLPLRQQHVSPALDEIIVYPQVPQKKKTERRKSQMPKHLSGLQMIDYLQDKRLKKQEEENEKERRKKEREEKRKRKEAEKEKKMQEREEKIRKAKQSKVQKNGSSRGRGRKATGARGAIGKQVCVPEESSSEEETAVAPKTRQHGGTKSVNTSNSEDELVRDDDEDILCPKCGEYDCLDGNWLCCDNCDRWYHVSCVGLVCENISDVDWVCSSCESC